MTKKELLKFLESDMVPEDLEIVIQTHNGEFVPIKGASLAAPMTLKNGKWEQGETVVQMVPLKDKK